MSNERFESEAYALMRRLRALQDSRAAVTFDERAQAAKAITHYELSGDLRLIREWVNRAEWKATLLHSLECRCRICRERNR